MDSRNERVYLVIVAGIGVVLAVILQFIPPYYSYLSVIVAAIALIFAILAFALKDYFFLIEPISHMKGKTLTINTNDPFYIAANGKCIVVRSEGNAYATSFIKIPLYKSSTEMTDDEKFNFASLFSRMISLSAIPMRVSSQLNVVNKDEYIKVITEKMGAVEDRYNAMANDPNADRKAAERVKGEVNMWHNLLDNVTKANSQSQVAYATVTSAGTTEDEAVTLASINAEQLAAGISAALGVPATVANGDEMLLFIEPEYLIPPTTVTEFMKVDQK
ncbi:MAG: hypothetical protein KGH67_03950 [Candidatus Micrarchaeota archaeon]|nr:hypothetical protein [Candidatus Micrarchaeota archaeon]